MIETILIITGVWAIISFVLVLMIAPSELFKGEEKNTVRILGENTCVLFFAPLMFLFAGVKYVVLNAPRVVLFLPRFVYQFSLGIYDFFRKISTNDHSFWR